VDTPGFRDTLISHLAADGISFVTGIDSRATLLEVARKFVVPRIEAGVVDEDGVSTIRDEQGVRGEFISRELGPHTDGSTGTNPPRLLFLSCLTKAAEGGASHFWDGRAVYKELSVRHPEALNALMRADAAIFNGKRQGPMFETVTHGRVRPRMLLDLSTYSSETAVAIPTLEKILAERTVKVLLNPGEGYVVDNWRWLHGRGAFTGDRVALRVAGHTLLKIRLPAGFATSDL
jgi:alpha-ketoglutarate-dependent taurine dioxygenase